MRKRSGTAGLTALSLAALLLAACGEPIVARSPEALYALAKKQLASGSFTPAADTLARVEREAPESEAGRRAILLHMALLGGLARGYQRMGESYLAGSGSPGAGDNALPMRSVAMDYFGRARGRSTELVEALDRLLQDPPGGPLRLDVALPEPSALKTLEQVRQGKPPEDRARLEAERAEVETAIAEVLAGLAESGDDLARARTLFQASEVEVEPAAFYLEIGRQVVAVSGIFAPEALGDRRLFRLYHERALAAAERAAELATRPGTRALELESERLQEYCRGVLKKS